jgi:hypothetical protein
MGNLILCAVLTALALASAGYVSIFSRYEDIFIAELTSAKTRKSGHAMNMFNQQGS